MDDSDRLSSEEVRARATSGAAVLGVRAIVIYGVGIGANLLFARLLLPRDFGLLALGTVMLVLGTYLAEGGFGASLIRRERAPERVELEAVLGLQLATTTAAALIVAAVAIPFGRDGLVVATMAASLPLVVLRTPSVVVVERRLRYRVIATGDVVEALVYYAWSLGALALGFGIWGLATGAIVRASAGSMTITALGPVGFVRPRWAWATVRPFVGFGLKFQTAAVLTMARQQGLSVVVAIVGGLGTLGIWNLAWRVMQVPNLLFLVVGRVGFTAVARLMGAGRDVGPILERGMAVLAVVTGLLVTGIVGLATALPGIVGDEWSDIPEVILWSGFAVILASPVGVTAPGFLFAADEAGTVSKGMLASAVVWFGVAAALVPELGAPGVGIGWIAAGLVHATILGRRTAARSGAAILRRVGPPTAVSVAAIAAAWLVSRQADDELVGGLLGLGVGELVALAGLFAFCRPALRDGRELLVEAFAGLRGHAGAPA